MKMNVSTQTLLSEEVIELLLKSYVVNNGQNQIKEFLTDHISPVKSSSTSSTSSTGTSTQDLNKCIQTVSKGSQKDIEPEEGEGYMSNLPPDVIIGIARYISVEDFFNFSLTCKKLFSTFNCSSIWYNFLKTDYPQQFKTMKVVDDLYDTYRYFDTNTLRAKDLSIAEMGKNWKLDEEGCAVLTDVCWFDVNFIIYIYKINDI